jgi:hypothetical protein
LVGKYIRITLVEKIKNYTGEDEIESIFGWEIANRNEKRRIRRKIEQLIIDEMTFVVSGISGLVAFLWLVPKPHFALIILCLVELVLLLILGVEIFIYADFAKGR